MHPSNKYIFTPLVFFVFLSGGELAAQTQIEKEEEVVQRERGKELLSEAVGSLQSGDYETADEKFREGILLVKSTSPTPEEVLSKGIIEIRKGNLDTADSLIRPLFSDPEIGNLARYNLAYALTENNRYREAIDVAGSALSDFDHKASITNLFLKGIEKDKSVATLFLNWLNQVEEKKIRDEPYTRLLESVSLYELGKLKAALEIIRELADVLPDEISVLSRLIQWSQETAGQSGVVAILSELREDRPEDLTLALNLAQALVDNKEVGKAHELMSEVMELPNAEDNASVVSVYADTSLLAEEWNDAVEAYQLLVGMVKGNKPSLASAKFNLSVSLLKRGDESDLENALSAMWDSQNLYMELGKEQSAAYFYIGLAYNRLGRWQDAEFFFRRYDRMVRIYDPETFQLLGDIYMNRQNWQGAVDAFSKGLRDIPAERLSPAMRARRIALLARLAEAQMEVGDAESAIVSAAQAEDLIGDGEEAGTADERLVRIVKARALHEQGRYPLALSVWQSGRNRFPGDDEFVYGYTETLLMNNNVGEVINITEEEGREGPRWRMLRANAQVLEGKVEEAEKIFSELEQGSAFAAEASIGLAEIALQKARSLLESGGSIGLALDLVETAERQYRKAKISSPNDPKVVAGAIECASLKGRLEDRLETGTVEGATWKGIVYGGCVMGLLALIPFGLYTNQKLKQLNDFTRRGGDWVDSVEARLRIIFEKVVKKKVVEKAVAIAGGAGLAEEEKEEAWSEAILGTLGAIDPGRARTAAKIHSKGVSVMESITLGDLVDLIIHPKGYPEVLRTFSDPETQRVVGQELRFVKDCRNAIRHLRELPAETKKRFFRTVGPLDRSLSRALDGLEKKSGVTV